VDRPRPVGEPGRAVIALIHRLLILDESASWSLERVAAELTSAFEVTGAGLANLATGQLLVRCSPGDNPASCPWLESAQVLEQMRDCWPAVPILSADRSWLLAAGAAPLERGGWLVFLEDRTGRDWSAAERSSLLMAVHALARATLHPELSRWGRQLDRLRKQQRLEEAARIVQRLAHDYSNFLTTILGFSELSLNLPTPGQLRATYLQEVHRGAAAASRFTERLRLFSRRGTPGPRSANLAVVVAEEAEELRAAWGSRVRLDLDLPPDLPLIFVTEDLLRQILRGLLDNAWEAMVEPGTVTVTARQVALTEEACLDFLGDPRPGPALEVRVTDDGCGLSPEVRSQVLASPFFSTKPGRRGLGLASIYGILFSHRGGLSLEPRPGGGTEARFVLPLAHPATPTVQAQPTAGSIPEGAPSLPPASRRAREKVLVVDDDPLVLRLVCTTLEQDGYRVQTARSGAEAWHRYVAPSPEPIRLVLSDLVMPLMTGVDLARRLVQHDANVNLLFMSGRVSADLAPENWGGVSFPLLRKPFRPEGLLRAVRAALDAGPTRLPRWGASDRVSEPPLTSSP
jgi:signal transduction histidine kinase/ActR/RegA family two-component response regulator